MQATDQKDAGRPARGTKARGLTGLFRGAWAAVRGMLAATGNRDVFRVYGRMTLALIVTTMVVGGLMIYGVLSLAELLGDGTSGATDGAGAAGAAGAATEVGYVDWMYDVLLESGRYFVSIVGVVLAALIAPVLSMLVLGIVFPMFAESIFLAALRPLDAARADKLKSQTGLSISASIMISLRVLTRFILLTLFAFAIGFIPLLGPIAAPVITLWVTSQTLTWELLDPYFSKSSMKYAAQKQYVKAHGGGVLGFGVPLSFLLAIPLIGPLFFGLAQAGAATLLVDVLEPKA
ncbi:MAG: hypothetical protein Tsb0020_24930 [Haliangiales bacterium]